MATIAAATQVHRAPWLRWMFFALSLGMFFAPFAFSFDDVSDREIYYAVMAGHMLLVSSIVTARLFAQDDKAWTRASDVSRSSGSNTSSVSTPSK